MSRRGLRHARVMFEAEIENIIKSFLKVTSISSVDLKTSRMLASQAFVVLAVRLEVFTSDLTIAYIKLDKAKFDKIFVDSITSSIESKFGSVGLGHCVINSPPSDLTIQDIRHMVDPGGFNLTYKNYSVFESQAQKYLSSNHLKKIRCADVSFKSIYNLTKVIRNVIVHESTGAYMKMNDMLVDSNLPDTLKRGQNNIFSVGTYLFAKPVNNDSTTRFEIIADKLLKLSKDICIY